MSTRTRADGLRQLAAFLDRHPDIDPHVTYPIVAADVSHAATADELVAAVVAESGRPAVSGPVSDGREFSLATIRFDGDVSLHVLIDRSAAVTS